MKTERRKMTFEINNAIDSIQIDFKNNVVTTVYEKKEKPLIAEVDRAYGKLNTDLMCKCWLGRQEMLRDFKNEQKTDKQLISEIEEIKRKGASLCGFNVEPKKPEQKYKFSLDSIESIIDAWVKDRKDKRAERKKKKMTNTVIEALQWQEKEGATDFFSYLADSILSVKMSPMSDLLKNDLNFSDSEKAWYGIDCALFGNSKSVQSKVFTNSWFEDQQLKMENHWKKLSDNQNKERYFTDGVTIAKNPTIQGEKVYFESHICLNTYSKGGWLYLKDFEGKFVKASKKQRKEFRKIEDQNK